MGVGDKAQAKRYWTKSLELHPQHFRALISLSQELLGENKPSEAVPFLERAIRTEPSSWRAHALMAEAHLRQGSLEESIKQAERALELGHGKATVVQLVLAAALIRHGERERAATILKGYLQEHPGDREAKKQLAFLETPPSQVASVTTMDVDADTMSPTVGEEIGDALPSNWLPPDVDEKVPPVEPGATCALDDVLQKAGKQVQEFVKNVDRFTASEFLKHEAVDKWGIAGSTETRKFDYVVAVEEPKPGFLNVEEYRGGPGAVSEFPGGVATMGLPALPLIFHPYNAVNFEMTCEGLTRWNGTLAWQVHFRQRRDKPNTIRSYRLGMDGPSYPVALKGRAWILADSFQIARLETDLIAPVPQIRLVADHTAIEYGPVRFRIREVEMWLPQSAEVFYDWRGKRIHRRHSFSNYMLFGVDQKQRISQPKVEAQIPPEK
jgi:tetratricopeptide repeat protein